MMSLKGQWRRCEVEKKSSLRWCLRRVGKCEESESVSGFISAVYCQGLWSVLLQSQL